MNNRYGVDVSYFKKELTSLIKSLPDRPKEELYNYLTALANIVKPPTLVQQSLSGSDDKSSSPKSAEPTSDKLKR